MIFLTGTTGFLGQELLSRISASRPDTEFCLLVRPLAGEDADTRLSQILAMNNSTTTIENLKPRIRIVSGDLLEHNFGLGDAEFLDLAKKISSIYHCAASTELDLSFKDSCRINVGGTNEVVRLAIAAKHANPNFERLNHISTAYVAGTMKGIVNPEQLDLNQDFRNSYEQSKALAESSVRTLEGSVPYFIYRPSIIVGDSITGKTSTFNVLYVPARFIAKGLFRALPALPNIPFDVVPVDYVADAIDLLSRPGNQLGKHRCFHLCAGVGRESSPKEILLILIETINKYYQRTRGLLHMPSLVSPELLSRAFSTLSAAKNSMMHLEELVTHHIPVLRKTLPFIPYMVSNPRFEMKRTCSALHNLLEPAPLFNSYAETIFRYCLDTNWGKNSPILAPQG